MLREDRFGSQLFSWPFKARPLLLHISLTWQKIFFIKKMLKRECFIEIEN
jgi:hypothetical protein